MTNRPFPEWLKAGWRDRRGHAHCVVHASSEEELHEHATAHGGEVLHVWHFERGPYYGLMSLEYSNPNPIYEKDRLR